MCSLYSSLRRILAADNTDPAGADHSGLLCSPHGKRYGFLSLVIYLLLGMAGVPVFSMMRAGVSVIAGPSGGFIVGFAVMAFIVGLVGEKLGFTFKNMLLGTVLGTAACS